MHKALEEGYSSPGRGDAARRVLAESIARDWPLAEALGPDSLKKFESEAELCVIMLEGFIDWAAEEGLDAGWDVVAHERLAKAPPVSLRGDRVVLKGKLDQLARRELDGALFMRDWKTTATKDPVMMAFKPQLKTYLLLLALTEPDARVSGGSFVFLRKVKRSAKAEPPFYWEEALTVGPREMASFWRSTLAVLDEIVAATQRLEAGEDHRAVAPPRPSRDCSWRCPFYRCCEMFDDGSHVEAYVEANYRSGDPYEYYGDIARKHGDEGTTE
jgi:hypothetical protein